MAHLLPEDGQQTQTAPLAGARIALRPLEVDEDYEFLYALATDDDLAFRWLLRGSTLPFDAFIDALSRNCLTQFIAWLPDSQERIGHLIAYEPDLRNRHAAIGLASVPSVWRSGILLEGLILFLNYIFWTWDLRKVYSEVIEYNFDAFASGQGKYFNVEGKLRAHEYGAGRYWDLYILAIHRDDFARWGPRAILATGPG